MKLEISKRIEIKNRKGYDRFLDGLDPSSVHHCEIVYHDGRRGTILLGSLHNYDSAISFASEKSWAQRNPEYQFIGPRDVRMYAVIDWAPEGIRTYEAQEVSPEPRRAFALSPALGRI